MEVEAWQDERSTLKNAKRKGRKEKDWSMIN
jgi:hypothetical protein